ncbi:hypothetical protein SAMN05443633_104317 [Chryseobacterium arachidis]|uniref:Uncharacterized protein n=1 Tax=Chryseobacterium arachidis TaxID=1416778 RepID=A0A1M5BW31_9FLAO|nr:hypothetical protein [Chryseobacterium arachidis]SHF46793.1 hypothetical protein SAMN05443633_104317 [Chryseobacterium arachidis]
MASLYNAKVKSIDAENKIVVLDLDTIHPDAMYFSNNLAFALRLIHDAALGDSPIAKSFDAYCLFDKNWLKDNTKGYISKCELDEVRAPEVTEIMNDGKESYWRGETSHAHATMTIHFTSHWWMKHLNPKSNWKCTAYPADVDFIDRAPIDPSHEGSDFSEDYKNSGGWVLVKSDTLRGAESFWTEEMFIPIYTEKSYRRINKLSGADLNKSTLDALLYKTVFSLGRNGFKNFGVFVPADENRYGIISFSKGGYSGAYYEIADLLTLGASEFNINDSTKAVRFEV